MAKICLCLTGKTLARNLEMIDRYRAYIDLAELRVDCLSDDEHDSVRRFPALAGLPVILTVRRKNDGGHSKYGESSRIVILSKALAFAHPDSRHNFAYVDLEEDLDVPSLEEVARAFGTRIIRSFHNFEGTPSNLSARIKSLYHVGDEIAKISLMPKSLDDVRTLFEISKELRDKEKILIAMGDLGQCTRILAEKLGSYLTYTCAKYESEMQSAAPGQIDPVELCDLFHFREINDKTTVYGISGYPLRSTGSPLFYNNIFNKEKMNNVYVRFPSAKIESFLQFADTISLAGASITVPHKEAVLKYLSEISDEVKSVGACNTIVRTERGWAGYNTDTSGFQGSLLNLINSSAEKTSVPKRLFLKIFPRNNNLKGKRCTVIGAGGASRAVCAVLSRLQGKALILNRDIVRAKELAALYKFEYGPLDEESAKRMKKFRDIIIQTTSVGMEPNIDKDPVPSYEFDGSEIVIDIIYKPAQTKFLQRAIRAGCKAINGEDMLYRQGLDQYACFFGTEYPVDSDKRR
ncbi:MAG: type I 3-dehydroquinate dehydratase [Spirochaetaceae bacterium]|nr:type I 3-dehydroquinate dehydratase [Spirochaetaceae bacterium]